MLTDEQLAEWERMWAAASPPPWKAWGMSAMSDLKNTPDFAGAMETIKELHGEEKHAERMAMFEEGTETK